MSYNLVWYMKKESGLHSPLNYIRQLIDYFHIFCSGRYGFDLCGSGRYGFGRYDFCFACFGRFYFDCFCCCSYPLKSHPTFTFIICENGVIILLKPKQFIGVIVRNFQNFVERFFLNFGNFLCCQINHFGMIGFAAEGHGRKIGRIGFKQ